MNIEIRKKGFDFSNCLISIKKSNALVKQYLDEIDQELVPETYSLDKKLQNELNQINRFIDFTLAESAMSPAILQSFINEFLTQHLVDFDFLIKLVNKLKTYLNIDSSYYKLSNDESNVFEEFESSAYNLQNYDDYLKRAKSKFDSKRIEIQHLKEKLNELSIQAVNQTNLTTIASTSSSNILNQIEEIKSNLNKIREQKSSIERTSDSNELIFQDCCIIIDDPKLIVNKNLNTKLLKKVEIIEAKSSRSFFGKKELELTKLVKEQVKKFTHIYFVLTNEYDSICFDLESIDKKLMSQKMFNIKTNGKNLNEIKMPTKKLNWIKMNKSTAWTDGLKKSLQEIEALSLNYSKQDLINKYSNEIISYEKLIKDLEQSIADQNQQEIQNRHQVSNLIEQNKQIKRQESTDQSYEINLKEMELAKIETEIKMIEDESNKVKNKLILLSEKKQEITKCLEEKRQKYIGNNEMFTFVNELDAFQVYLNDLTQRRVELINAFKLLSSKLDYHLDSIHLIANNIKQISRAVIF